MAGTSDNQVLPLAVRSKDQVAIRVGDVRAESGKMMQKSLRIQRIGHAAVEHRAAIPGRADDCVSRPQAGQSYLRVSASGSRDQID
jgi:hypothetical protein